MLDFYCEAVNPADVWLRSHCRTPPRPAPLTQTFSSFSSAIERERLKKSRQRQKTLLISVFFFFFTHTQPARSAVKNPKAFRPLPVQTGPRRKGRTGTSSGKGRQARQVDSSEESKQALFNKSTLAPRCPLLGAPWPILCHACHIPPALTEPCPYVSPVWDGLTWNVPNLCPPPALRYSSADGVTSL